MFFITHYVWFREFPESEISSYFTLRHLQSISAASNNYSLLVRNESIMIN